MEILREFTQDQLVVRVLATRDDLGNEAARDVAERLRQLLARQESVTMMFAAAPSQSEFLAQLVSTPGIDWSRIKAFHLDEYVGLGPEQPQRFSEFLNNHLFSRVPFQEVFYIDIP